MVTVSGTVLEPGDTARKTTQSHGAYSCSVLAAVYVSLHNKPSSNQQFIIPSHGFADGWISRGWFSLGLCHVLAPGVGVI